MSHSTAETIRQGFSRRSVARITYLAVFLVLYYGTDLFARYDTLLWLALLGLVVVFFDAVICARRRWRVVKTELHEEVDGEQPNC
ncbi:MAG: hypothetical protein ACOCP2_03315 [Halohasta sp.]